MFIFSFSSQPAKSCRCGSSKMQIGCAPLADPSPGKCILLASRPAVAIYIVCTAHTFCATRTVRTAHIFYDTRTVCIACNTCTVTKAKKAAFFGSRARKNFENTQITATTYKKAAIFGSRASTLVLAPRTFVANSKNQTIL